MSFEINWEQLISDNIINDSIQEFLDYQFQNISLPLYINDLSVTNFSLGDQPPEVIVRHIGDPFDDFYDEEGEEKVEAREEEEDDEEDEEDDENEDDEGETTTASISEDMTTNHIYDENPLHVKPSPPPLERLRTSLDSISLMLGNSTLNYMHNYNMNNIIGLGPNNGTETPKAILNPNSRKTNQFLAKNQPNEPSLRAGEKAQEKDVNDIQLIAEIKYSGNLQIEVVVNLLVNYPSPNFISLPIKLHITDLVIHSIATIAYLKKSIFFSFLCDIDDTTSDYFTLSSTNPEPSRTPPLNSGGNFVDYMTGPNNRERIDIIKNIRIESEIGEVENNVLRNVGKVEKFLIDQLRSIIRDEVAWPSWICFDMNEDEEDEVNLETTNE